MDEILEYIKKSKQQKISEEEIKNQLLKTGWLEKDIQKVLNIANNTQPPLPPVPPPHKSTTLTSDFGIWITFANILLFISLYVMTISLGTLLNRSVDIWIPPAIQSTYPVSTFYDYTIKMSLATLIVSWPFFSILFLYITKKTTENPIIRNIRSRKLLIYLTLIVTFVIVLANLIGTVFSFLNGSVTANFLAHFSVNAGISSIVFIYLFNQVKHDRK